jgi:hypothetical protein
MPLIYIEFVLNGSSRFAFFVPQRHFLQKTSKNRFS